MASKLSYKETMGYVSKDFVHEGCGLPLQPDLVWDNIPYSVHKNIKKAENNNVKIVKVDGNSEDISILKSMWYDPEDPNMPHRLSDKEYMFIAYNEHNVPIGATILLPVGNHLFLNNLAANKDGKELRAQDYLLWHCVNYFAQSEFKYIDVGVSYRPSLYKFFTKWKVWSYPVIFNVPEIKLDIPFYPFNSSVYSLELSNNYEHTLEYLKAILKSDKITFVPKAEYATKILQDFKYEPLELTYNFASIIPDKPFFIDLKKVFSVQFGCIIAGIELTDQEIWNNYGCLDIFKRQFVFNSISDELEKIVEIIKKREMNYNLLKEHFSLEDIEPEQQLNQIPDLFVFVHNENSRYSAKLKEFGIEHYVEGQKVGLPIHQNLSPFQLEYMYAIFRGVLNLCSEWEHTDKYDKYKS